jgi:hypothetical protein
MSFFTTVHSEEQAHSIISSSMWWKTGHTEQIMEFRKLKGSEFELGLVCLRKLISNLIDGSITKAKANEYEAQR